jgi:hypothetical protein
VYVQHTSLWYDLRLMCRTIYVLVSRALGRNRFDDPPEMKSLHPAAQPTRDGVARTH